MNRFLSLSLAPAVVGCVALNQRATNLTPAYLYLAPSTSSYQDPEASLTGYHTFSVFPASVLGIAAANELMEKQILFFLRNSLEAKGYHFVPLDERPDFLATISLSAQYHESQVPPSTAVLPIWVPGRTITSQSTSSGSFSYSTYGSYSSYGWGTYSGQSTASTYVPGYLSTRTVVRPGYTVGRWHPVAQVAIIDGRSFKAVWIGTGAGTSDNSDPRISGQLVVTAVLGRFSNAPATANANPSPGMIGVNLLSFTSDGNNYLPTVTGVAPKSPAESAGIQLYDMILSIDGQPMVNQPLSEAMKTLAGNPGAKTQIQIWRMGKQLTFTLVRALR